MRLLLALAKCYSCCCCCYFVRATALSLFLSLSTGRIDAHRLVRRQNNNTGKNTAHTNTPTRANQQTTTTTTTIIASSFTTTDQHQNRHHRHPKSPHFPVCRHTYHVHRVRLRWHRQHAQPDLETATAAAAARVYGRRGSARVADVHVDVDSCWACVCVLRQLACLLCVLCVLAYIYYRNVRTLCTRHCAMCTVCT